MEDLGQEEFRSARGQVTRGELYLRVIAIVFLDSCIPKLLLLCSCVMACLYSKLVTKPDLGFYGFHKLICSCCSWGSQGKNTGVVCHSLFQWTMFCQNSPP